MASNGKGNGKKSRASTPPEKRDETRDEASEQARDQAPEAGASRNGKVSVSPVSADASPSEGDAEAKGASEAAPAEEPEKVVAESEDVPPLPHEKDVAATIPHADEVRGAAWGHPLARFDHRWTWLESRLLTFVLVWQILALVAWVLLNGLSESVTTTAGSVFRAVILASAAGAGAWAGTKKRPEAQRRNATLAAVAAGLAIIVAWRAVASPGAGLDGAVVKYFDNLKGWLQEGSTLTLLGGLRGLGTRLTLWLALLGGSLATASGKHIHVDVVFRFLPKWARLPVSLLNYVFAAVVCFAAVWGFFDHIAIESYGSRADDTAGAKIANAAHHIGNHAFLTRKQLGLDLRSLPHVLTGQRYDQWMTAAAWNEWVDGAGFEDHYPADQVKNLKVPDGTHPPFVVSPDGETTRSALAHTLGLVFPFGLLAIGLRFLLRALLTLSGHFEVDPDEAHKEEIGQHGADEARGAEGGA